MAIELLAQGAAVSFMRTAARNGDVGTTIAWGPLFSNKTTSLTNTVLAMLEARDPDKAAKLREDQDRANEILRRLETSKSDQKRKRKAAAKQRVEQLKQQIIALRMMMSGDPEAVARLVARLARELASAAKAYAMADGAAGSGSLPLGGTDLSATTPSTAVPSSATAAATPADISTPLTSASAASTGEAASAPPPLAREGDVPQNAVGAPWREMVEQQMAKADQDAAARKEDSDFISDVRRLMNILKSILMDAKRDMQLDDHEQNEHVAKAEKALAETEMSIGDISANTIASMGALSPIINFTI